MAIETQIMDQATAAARDVGGRALQQSGGFFSSLLMSPINLLGSMARKGFAGIMSWGIPATLLTGGAMLFAPGLFRGLGELTGRTDLSDRLGEEVKEGGPVRAALIAMGAGAAIGGGVGMASGAWQSLTGGSADEPQSTGATLGRTLGTVATFGAIAAVTIGAINSKGTEIRHDDKADDADVQVPPMPGRAAAARAPDA